MGLMSPIACMLDRHKPDRRKVDWDGRSYVGTCKHCGKPIKRRSRGNWREAKPKISS